LGSINTVAVDVHIHQLFYFALFQVNSTQLDVTAKVFAVQNITSWIR